MGKEILKRFADEVLNPENMLGLTMSSGLRTQSIMVGSKGTRQFKHGQPHSTFVIGRIVVDAYGYSR